MVDPMRYQWANRLLAELNRQGISYNELSKRSGVSVDSIKKYCGGKVAAPHASRTEAISAALSISPIWLMTGIGLKYTPQEEEDDPVAIDVALLRTIIDIVEGEVARTGTRPRSEKYAQLVAFCYQAAQTRDPSTPIDEEAIRQAFILAS